MATNSEGRTLHQRLQTYEEVFDMPGAESDWEQLGYEARASFLFAYGLMTPEEMSRYMDKIRNIGKPAVESESDQPMH